MVSDFMCVTLHITESKRRERERGKEKEGEREKKSKRKRNILFITPMTLILTGPPDCVKKPE